MIRHDARRPAPNCRCSGQVIGINSAIASGTGFYIGYGFAIPINLVRAVMGQLARTGRVERAVMGLSIRDATEEDAGVVGLKQITGVVVNGYTNDDSPAKQAGIQPGDVIVSLGGEPVESTPQLQERVGFKKPGETVEVTLLRQRGETRTVTLRLARAPSDVKPDVDPARPHPISPGSTGGISDTVAWAWGSDRGTMTRGSGVEGRDSSLPDSRRGSRELAIPTYCL